MIEHQQLHVETHKMTQMGEKKNLSCGYLRAKFGFSCLNIDQIHDMDAWKKQK